MRSNSGCITALACLVGKVLLLPGLMLWASESSPMGAQRTRASSYSEEASDTRYVPFKILKIFSNTKARVGNLGIAVGHVREAEYTDETGVKRRGLSAGISILVRGDPSKNMKLMVHEGQRFEVAGYSLFVEGISQEKRGSVRLRVQEPPKP